MIIFSVSIEDQFNLNTTNRIIHIIKNNLKIKEKN